MHVWEKKSQHIEQISTGQRWAKADKRRRGMQVVMQDAKGSRGIGRRARKRRRRRGRAAVDCDGKEGRHRNEEGWWGTGDKWVMGGGMGDEGRGGAKEAAGLGDCSAFILLSSSLLKHYLRKRKKKDFKAGWLLLGTDLLIPADTRGSAAVLWGVFLGWSRTACTGSTCGFALVSCYAFRGSYRISADDRSQTPAPHPASPEPRLHKPWTGGRQQAAGSRQQAGASGKTHPEDMKFVPERLKD